jgi:TRAP-type C4-dicarboxylate transport system permease small subunit
MVVVVVRFRVLKDYNGYVFMSLAFLGAVFVLYHKNNLTVRVIVRILITKLNALQCRLII